MFQMVIKANLKPERCSFLLTREISAIILWTIIPQHDNGLVWCGKLKMCEASFIGLRAKTLSLGELAWWTDEWAKIGSLYGLVAWPPGLAQDLSLF
ncbi:hypothetical protein ACSBR1_017039 [Camellia fascicularis]